MGGPKQELHPSCRRERTTSSSSGCQTLRSLLARRGRVLPCRLHSLQLLLFALLLVLLGVHQFFQVTVFLEKDLFELTEFAYVLVGFQLVTRRGWNVSISSNAFKRIQVFWELQAVLLPTTCCMTIHHLLMMKLRFTDQLQEKTSKKLQINI